MRIICRCRQTAMSASGSSCEIAWERRSRLSFSKPLATFTTIPLFLTAASLSAVCLTAKEGVAITVTTLPSAREISDVKVISQGSSTPGSSFGLVWVASSRATSSVKGDHTVTLWEFLCRLRARARPQPPAPSTVILAISALFF